jgi:hypothetical protein
MSNGSAQPHPTPEVRLEWHPRDKRGKVQMTVHFPYGPPFTDVINILRSKDRVEFVDHVCTSRSGIDKELLFQEMEEIAATITKQSFGHAAPTHRIPDEREALLAAADNVTDALIAQTEARDIQAAAKLLENPNLMDEILRDIESMGVAGERELAALVYIQGTSRLLMKPLNVIVQGSTSSGKSYVPLSISKLFPPEAVIMATAITPNALYYSPPGSLMHKFVVAGERPRIQDDERAEATKALREMLESGVLSKLVTGRSSDGQLTSTPILQHGPIAHIESTTVASVFDEDLNRCLAVGTDESAEQTARVVRSQAARECFLEATCDDIIAKHRTAQRMLKRVKVKVPFAESIAAAIPTNRQEARRAMPMILNMIKAVALLHQRQRETGPINHDDLIEATHDDYTIARKLLIGPMGRALGGALPEPVSRFGERLIAKYGSEPFTSTQALSGDRVLSSKGKVNEHLSALADAAVVQCIEPSRGPKPSVWRVVGDLPKAGAGWLPTVEQLGCSSS